MHTCNDMNRPKMMNYFKAAQNMTEYKMRERVPVETWMKHVSKYNY